MPGWAILLIVIVIGVPVALLAVNTFGCRRAPDDDPRYVVRADRMSVPGQSDTYEEHYVLDRLNGTRHCWGKSKEECKEFAAQRNRGYERSAGIDTP